MLNLTSGEYSRSFCNKICVNHATILSWTCSTIKDWQECLCRNEFSVSNHQPLHVTHTLGLGGEFTGGKKSGLSNTENKLHVVDRKRMTRVLAHYEIADWFLRNRDEIGKLESWRQKRHEHTYSIPSPDRCKWYRHDSSLTIPTCLHSNGRRKWGSQITATTGQGYKVKKPA